MAWGTPDLYNQPEAFGLEGFGDVDRGGSYEFDIFAVWRSIEDPSLFYWGTDSGCSCPSPFEDHTSLGSTDGKGTARDAAEALKAWARNTEGAGELALLERLYAC